MGQKEAYPIVARSVKWDKPLELKRDRIEYYAKKSLLELWMAQRRARVRICQLVFLSQEATA